MTDVELILVRHALPHSVAKGGVVDPDLTEEGHRQSRLAAELLAGGAYGAVTAVVSSTMRRAVQTAEPLAGALGMTIECDARLVEFDRDFTSYGMGLDAYESRAAGWAAMNEGRWGDNRFDPAEFRDRVDAAMESIIERSAGGVVAVVCHAGVISAYLAGVLGTSRLLFFAPGYTSITRVLAGPGGHRELLSAGEAPHLLATPVG